MSVILVGADGKSIGTLTNNEVQNIMRASRQGSRAGSRRGSVYGGESSTKQTFNKMSRGTLIIMCLVVTFLCMILIGIGLFAPSWWTLDVTEYGQEWQFGLWLYCRRGGMRNEVGQTGLDMRQWICDLRRANTLANHRDFREQSSFVDADHNEVAVLICLSITFFCLIVAMFALCCAYFNKFVPACIAGMNFVAMVCALVGLLIYVISMEDVQARRFTSYNSVYMLNFGYAAYCAIAGAILCVVNLAITIPIVLLTFAYNKNEAKAQKYDGYSGGGGSIGVRTPKRQDDRLDVNAVRQLLSQQQRDEQYNRQIPQASQYPPYHPRSESRV